MALYGLASHLTEKNMDQNKVEINMSVERLISQSIGCHSGQTVEIFVILKMVERKKFSRCH